MRGTREETATVAFDPAFQGIGSDPSGGGYFTGIRVPTSRPDTDSPTNRYTFLLAWRRLAPVDVVIVDGWRQFVQLLATTTSGTEEDPGPTYERWWDVQDPFWHFSDGNITWHLQYLEPKAFPPSSWAKEGLAYQYGSTPALLFERAAEDTGGYLAPWGGQIPGRSLGGLGPVYDLRSQWRSNNAFHGLGIKIQGPGDIALFATVRQSVASTRARLVIPEGVTLPAGAPYFASPEDLFVMNSEAVADNGSGAAAIYGRIGGSIIIRDPSPFRKIPKDAQSRTWCGGKTTPRTRKGTKR